MAMIFERTLYRTLRVGFTGMTVFSVLFFFLYLWRSSDNYYLVIPISISFLNDTVRSAI